MDVENITKTFSSADAIKQSLVDFCMNAGAKILLAIAVYIVGRIIIGWLLKLFDKMEGVSRIDSTARVYLRNFLKAALYIILVVSIIGVLGVPTASVVTFIASCGVAIGLALQGALGNLAGGIMLLIFRPFNVGDYISAGGEEGNVKKISLFYTVLTTMDNKTVSIPNGALMNSNISNATAEDIRRVDLNFNAAGSVPVTTVQDTIMKVILANDKVLADPAPDVLPVAGIPGGLQYQARVWVKTADYWPVFGDLMRTVPGALGEAGIDGPSTPVKVSN